MSERIKGITVEIGGDTVKLNDALRKTDKQITNTQKSLKDVERLLKLDPTNTELLQQKQRLLAEAVEDTKTRLKALKEAQANFGPIDDKNRSQYEALGREIIATKQSLEKLQAAANESRTAMEKVAEVATKVGDAAGTVASKTKTLSTAAAGAVAGLGALAIKAGVAADDLNTMAKQSGFGTDEIQKWQYAADRIDVSVDDIVKSAQKMKKNMVSTSAETSAAWDELGVSVTDGNGELRDSTEVFYEVLEALSQVENETQRDVLAMQVFGKSADSLAGIVDDGGAALREMGAEAEAAGLILSQEALDGANAFNDGVDTLKAKTTAAMGAVGNELAQNMLPMMEKLVEKMSVVLRWVAQLDGGQLELLATILLVVAAISPMAKGIQSVTTIITTLTSIIPAITGGFALFTGAATTGTTAATAFAGALTLITGPVGITVAAIGLLVGAIVLLYNKSETFRNAILAIKDAVINGVSAAIEFLKNLPAKALQWGKDFIGGFVNGIKQSIGTVTGAVSDVAGKVRSFLHFSRPDVGPLRDYETWMPDFVAGLAKGLRDNQGELGRALQAVTSGMEASFAPVINASSTGTTTTVRHTFDPLRVEGVSDSGQFVAAAEYSVEEVLTDLMRRQSRL